MFKIFTGIIAIIILVLSVFIISCENNDGSLDPEGLHCDNEYLGDINMDGLPFTITDAVKYVDYIVYGLDSQAPYYDIIVENSDINGDGEVFTVSDLVTLIKIIYGDDSPVCPKPLKVKNYRYCFEHNIFAVDGELGALFIKFDRFTTVELLYDGVEMRKYADRVIVYSLTNDSFIGWILLSDAEVVKIEATTPEGDPVILQEC
jgi:hypothetical protein